MNTLLKQCGWETRRTLRNRQFVIFSLMMPIIFYFVLTKSLGASMSMPGQSSNVYFLISMATFSAVSSCLFGLAGRISFERNQGWLRLVQTTPLRNSVYVISKILGQLVVSFASTLLLFLVGALFEGAKMSAGDWILSLVSMTFGSIPFVALGILLGVMLSAEAVYVVINILNMLLTIVGGMWWPLSMMPKVMQEIGTWLPTYRFANLAWDISAGKSIQMEDVGVLVGYALIFMFLTLWLLRRQEEK